MCAKPETSELGSADAARDDEDARLYESTPEGEREIVEAFLSRFVMTTDSAKKRDQIDIKLVLKALMTKVDEFNVYRCQHYDYECIQYALIDYSNEDQAQLFKFFDTKNKTRLNKLQTKASQTQRQTQVLREESSSVLTKLCRAKGEGKERGQLIVRKSRKSLNIDLNMEIHSLKQ